MGHSFRTSTNPRPVRSHQEPVGRGRQPCFEHNASTWPQEHFPAQASRQLHTGQSSRWPTCRFPWCRGGWDRQHICPPGKMGCQSCNYDQPLVEREKPGSFCSALPTWNGTSGPRAPRSSGRSSSVSTQPIPWRGYWCPPIFIGRGFHCWLDLPPQPSPDTRTELSRGPPWSSFSHEYS